MKLADYDVEAFSPQDLQRLEHSLNPSLLDWAVKNPLVRPSGNESRLIRDLAAIHSLGKVLLARGRIFDFKLAVSKGWGMSEQRKELYWHAPNESAGNAAGHMAVAKLLAGWYGLESADFERLRLPQDADEFADMETPGLQEAVTTRPRDLGITTFTASQLFIKTTFAVQDLVVAKGLDALDALAPYMDFPQFPAAN